jgi:hypothetical protein
MNFKLVFVFLISLIVISACSRSGGEVKKMSLEDVTQSMEKQGLKLLQIHPKGGNSPFGELNNVTAVTYAIDTYKMDKSVTDTINSSLSADVNVYIYVFESEQARIEGRKDFNEKLGLAKILSKPSVYEKSNVLIVHFKYPEEKTEYDDMIEMAVKNL